MPLLSLILLTPLAGAAALLVVDRRREQTIRRVAVACAGLDFLLAVPLWVRYDPLGPSWQFTERAALLPSIGASYSLGVDGYGSLVVLLTTLLGLLAVAASWTAITGHFRQHYIGLLVLQTGILGAVVALDALLFWLFWELVLIAVCALAIGVGHARSRFSTGTLLASVLVCSAALLLGILALHTFARDATGVATFDLTAYHQLTLPLARQKWIFAALTIGFVTAATVPLQAWFGHSSGDASAPPRVLIVPVMLTLAVYGLVRFNLPILPQASRAFIPAMATIALASGIYGAVIALKQTDWQRLLACVSLAHIGLITLGLFAVTPAALSGSLLHHINHAIAMTALFVIAGVISERLRTREIAAAGRVAAVMPICAVMFLVMTLSAIGLPGTNGFVTGRLIVKGVSVAHPVWAAVAVAGIVLAAGPLLWLYHRTMFGQVGEPVSAAIEDLGVRELATIVPLVGLAVWIGLYPEPFLARLEPTVARVLVRLEPGYAPAYSNVPGCGAGTAPAPSAPAGFTALAPCDDPSSAPKEPDGAGR